MSGLINRFKEKGYLLSPELLSLGEDELLRLYEVVEDNSGGLRVLDEEFFKRLCSRPLRDRVVGRGDNFRVEVVKSFDLSGERCDINGFVKLYTYRYFRLSEVLKQRVELRDAVPISQVLSMSGESVSVIGMVLSVDESRSGNVVVQLEDPSGSVKAVVSSRNSRVFLKARELVVDEVVGVVGRVRGGLLLVEDLFFPDVPSGFEVKKASDDVLVAYLSDIHVGSVDFMEKSFVKFLKYIRGLGERLGYLFISGDLVDGVGVYPGHEKDLSIKDIYKQYQVFSEFIKQVPEHVQVVIAPGNHDGLRLAEPQPVLYKEFVPDLFGLKNVFLVSNPAFVNIHRVDGFSGLLHLMYHGYSFDHYCLDVQFLRDAGGYARVEKVVEFLLRKRHLAPVHGSTLFVPCDVDRLVIDRVPDVVTTGHVHNLRVGRYRHVDLIACSTFQMVTGESFQERLGHIPTPGLVPFLNLKTREVFVERF